MRWPRPKPGRAIASRAVAILDEALATCDRTGYRAFEAELHRARGEILLKRDPANPAPAEEAFLTAIAVAKQQGTRSFELRAALVARQALSIDRPPRRRPRRPRARARRLFADARNARDRGGAGAVGGYRGRRACEARINTAMGFRAILSDAQRVRHGGNAENRGDSGRGYRRLQPARGDGRGSHPGAAAGRCAAI